MLSEGIGTFSQHYPRVATIVTAQTKGKANAMVAAWHLVISVNPPLYGASIVPERSTYELVANSKEFGVNFLPFEMAELITSAKDKVRHLDREVYGKR